MAYLKGFVDEDGNMRESEYFRGKTVWASLGVYKDKVRVHFCEWYVLGRFLRSYSGNDILFGNVFSRENNHKSPTFFQDFKETVGYLDVYFDDVKGDMLNFMLTRLNKDARIVLCGMSSMFSDTDMPKGLQHYTSLIAQRAKIHDPNEFFFLFVLMFFSFSQ